jgi:hypothetical protein
MASEEVNGQARPQGLGVDQLSVSTEDGALQFITRTDDPSSGRRSQEPGPPQTRPLPVGATPEDHTSTTYAPSPSPSVEDAGWRVLSGVVNDPRRPAPPAAGPGRWLRVVAGIKEDILDWVPEERPRYTRLGAIILNTGLLAGLSFLTALDHIVHVSMAVLIPLALFWAFVVISFDGWLIASTHGAHGGARLLMFIPRVVVSVLLGTAIAEPLVMWVFQPAITRNVTEHREQELGRDISLWRSCNLVTGETVQSAQCGTHVLDLPDAVSPLPQVEELRRTQKQRDALAAELKQLNADLRALDNTARTECNGTRGNGLSGQVGVGPNCRRNRQQADRFRVDNQLPQRQQQLTALNQKIDTLTDSVQTSGADYVRRIEQAISTAAKARRDTNTPQNIGILEQGAALERLADESSFVWVAQWLLRVLLVALDAMPVFVKIIGGTTTYDWLTRERTELARRMHSKDVESVESQFTHRKKATEEVFQSEVRARRAQREASERQEIDRLVARFRSGRREPDEGAATSGRRRRL